MLESKSLTTSILEHLRGEIITFKLKGGQKLNENQLSSDLRVSRPPLREAFRILEEERLIVSIPRKGRYVVEASQENFEKIFEARKMIEAYVMELLKAKKVKSLPRVEWAVTKALKAPFPSPDDSYEKWRYIETMDEFHLNLVDSVENEFLSHFYGTIRFNISRYQYWLRVLCAPELFRPEVAKALIQDHYQVLDLMQKGEYDKANGLLMAHIDGACRLMKENFLKNKEVSKSTAKKVETLTSPSANLQQ